VARGGARSHAKELLGRLQSEQPGAFADAVLRTSLGITCVLSYMVDHLVAAGLLRPVLRAFEPPPIPIHLVYPAGRLLPRKTRLLLDQLTEALRQKFANESGETGMAQNVPGDRVGPAPRSGLDHRAAARAGAAALRERELPLVKTA
jgi:hypothetical protein